MTNLIDRGRKVIGLPPVRARNDVDTILKYWRGKESADLPRPVIPEGALLSTVTMGLGDTLMLTDIPKATVGRVTSYSGSQHFRQLMKYNPHWREPLPRERLNLVNAPSLVCDYDCGNGHYLQRIRRSFSATITDVPKGCVAWKGKRLNNRVILHFEAGMHAQWQRQNIHPKARMLYPQTHAELEQFISEMPGYEFVLVGGYPNGKPIRGARHHATRNTLELVELMGSASWFIGIVSGPMHLATAMDLKCVVLVNIPGPEDVVLPTLKPVSGKHYESLWLYPQNVHLHLDGSTEICPQVSSKNLRRAFDGDVYPYWSQRFCAMVREQMSKPFALEAPPEPTDYSQWKEQPIILDFFGNRNGKFLDIGSFDGCTGSNTRALFERGWEGVCVEAHAGSFMRLAGLYRGQERVACINAAMASPKEPGIATLVDAGDQISTTYKDHKVSKWKKGQWEVGTINTEDIIEKFGDRFEFVSIDIEGCEMSVVPTLGPLLKHTQLVCTEDTIPNCAFDQKYYDGLLEEWKNHGFSRVIGRTYAVTDDKPSNTLLSKP